MKVVGLAVTYSIVPLFESEDTADGQAKVDLAVMFDEIDEDPRNGSLRPHW